MKISRKNLKLKEYQAVSAIGQIELINLFKKSLSKKIKIGQILLTLEDTENRRRALNAKDTIENIFKLKGVPIVNENDTTATNEIRYGDNDRLAARVAQITSSDTLVMLSDIDGLYTKDPKSLKMLKHKRSKNHYRQNFKKCIKKCHRLWLWWNDNQNRGSKNMYGFRLSHDINKRVCKQSFK